ncbi:hypothetical protein RJD24_08400 [Bacillaceae bacterium IKA-2]|nr:hypothetical protein RJD24_08400 [Bacillaceae bacterium IKA-2]
MLLLSLHIKKATAKNPIAYFYTDIDNKFAQQFYEPEEAALEDEGGFVYTRNQSFYNYLTR